MKIPDKCSLIEVVYSDGSNDTFIPTSKVEELEDSYEFEEKEIGGDKNYMVILMTSEIRKIRFAKG